MNHKILFAAAMLSCAALTGARAEVCSNITNAEVTVDSRNDEWTTADVKAKAGDLILVVAVGSIHTYQIAFRDVTAKGAPNGIGQLQMKVGSGTVIPVGDRWVGAFNDPGTLKFRVEGNSPKMSGSYTVHVIVIPKGTLPPSVKVDNQ